MTPPPPSQLVMGVSGVRGRVGEGLTPEVVTLLAAAHGALLLRRGSGAGRLERTVVLGRDSRPSGPMFRDAAVAGLLSVGCDVVDLGLAPTPTVLLAVRFLGAVGGMVITASHNPVEWNAAKLVSARGLFLTGEEAAETLALFGAGAPPRVGWSRVGRARREEGFIERHLERVLAAPEVDVERVRARRFRVVLDACHGVGGLLLVPLLERLGCEVEVLAAEPTGLFPRPPEPLPVHLRELGSRVRTARADVGLALDPDGDRLALVSGTGQPVGEDLTLALAVERVLACRKGPVVANLSTSRVVADAAARGGAALERTAVGEIHVVERMLELGSPIGGEGNGGVVYPAVHPTRDAAAAAALVLSLLAVREASLEAVVAALPRYAIVKEALPLSQGFDPLGDGRLEELFPGAVPDRRDGARFEWEGERAWLHVRRSGTEPLARIIAEAPTLQRARELVARARAALAPGLAAAASAPA